MSVEASDLLGRHRELSHLRSALTRARDGAGGLMLLAGEAGIGKTRLAEELAATALREGVRVVRGRSSPEDGASPYRPWIQALRNLLEVVPEDAREDIVAPDAPHLAELLPEIRRDRAALPSSPELNPETARFRLFDAVTSLLRRAAQRDPLLLILEDLHWADAASLRLLAFVGRELLGARILILGTRRGSPPIAARAGPDPLAQVRYQTLRLEGLGREDVGRLLSIHLTRPASRRLVASVHRQTAGNPFYVAEIARGLAARGDRPAGHGGGLAWLELPESVRSAIAARLDGLDGETCRVLGVAAVLGHEFTLSGLSGVIDGEREERLATAAIEHGQGAGVLEPGTGDRHRFRHDLIRQALYENLPPSRRADTHLLVARALEQAHGPTGGEHAAEMAHHWSRAGPGCGGEHRRKVTGYSLAAGERALAAHAYEEAAEHLARALDAGEEGLPGVERIAARVSLARARAASAPRWTRQDAWDELGRAIDERLARGDLPGAVRAAVLPSISPEGAVDVADRLAHLLDEVEAESPEAGRLAARHGAAIYFETANYTRARESLGRAITTARALGDRALELQALAWSNAVDHFEGRWAQVVDGGRAVVRLAEETDDLHSETYARYRLGFALAWAGRPREARREARVALSAAQRLGDHGLLGDTAYVSAALAHLTGKWEEADRHIESGLAASPDHLPLLHLAALGGFERGEEDRAARFLERTIETGLHAGPYPLARGLCVLARAQLSELVGPDAEDRLPDPPRPILPLADALEAIADALEATRQRNVGDARLHLRRLDPLSGSITAPMLVTGRLLGRLASTVGEETRARDRFEAAVSFCRVAGFRPELGWSCHDYARFLLERRAATDAGALERAAALLEEARKIATDLSMTPLVQSCDALSERLPPGSPARAADLTVREREVLALVADGRTNREIAHDLAISPHTVAVHVARILEKTHCRNRTEAARFALAHALVSPPGSTGPAHAEARRDGRGARTATE